MPLAMWSWLCGFSLAGITFSNPAGAWNVVCFHVGVTASGLSLIQRNATRCGVSERDREALVMRRLWPTGGCYSIKKILLLL